MASFYDREYTAFEKSKFVQVFVCPSSNQQHQKRHCELCEVCLVPPRGNRVSSDNN